MLAVEDALATGHSQVGLRSTIVVNGVNPLEGGGGRRRGGGSLALQSPCSE
jgi:hypothetical protein